MKVFVVTVFPPKAWGFESQQVKAYVKASSQAKAVEALKAAGVHMTVSHLRNYGRPVGSEHPASVFLGFDPAGTVAASDTWKRGDLRTVHDG